MTPGRERWRDPPAPFRAAERGTWAHVSVVERLPEIGRRVLRENEFSEPVRGRIERLIDEIPTGPIRPIEDPQAPDAPDWHRYVEPHAGSDWLQAPWFFVETFFYRRIVAAVGHFQTQPANAPDPFRLQKARGLENAKSAAAEALTHDDLHDRLLAALWANQADLSLWPESRAAEESAPSPASERILIDDRAAIAQFLRADPASFGRVDLILDNAGSELAADLCLTQTLLDLLPSADIHLHAKAHPTFVSDATPLDVENTLQRFAESPDSSIRALARRLRRGRQEGRLVLEAPWFWTSPCPGWEMPERLRGDLARSDLLISKGDANYRRLLGDRHWDPTAPLDEILSYSPAPVAALRSLKSELAAGLTPALVERASGSDPKWMTNGRWALVQFSRPSG